MKKRETNRPTPKKVELAARKRSRSWPRRRDEDEDEEEAAESFRPGLTGLDDEGRRECPRPPPRRFPAKSGILPRAERIPRMEPNVCCGRSTWI